MTDTSKYVILQSEREKKREEKTMIVKFSYFFGEFKEGMSKVYDIQKRMYPSGLRVVYKVWNADRQ